MHPTRAGRADSLPTVPAGELSAGNQEDAMSRQNQADPNEELDPSVFKTRTSKLTPRKVTKADLLHRLEKMGVDVREVRTAMYDPDTTLMAQHLVLDFLRERSDVQSELDVAKNDIAVQELKENRRKYQPVPREQVRAVAQGMTDPHTVRSSDGTFVIDVAGLGNQMLSDKRRDLERRLFDRTQLFTSAIATLSNK
jgi:DNA-binding transcriptional MerR regulator